MTPRQSNVRAPHVSSKACVVRDGRILLIRYQDVGEEGCHYNLPGGKVLANENLHEACARKFREEAGGLIRPGDLMFVYEYIGVNHGYQAGDKHSVSLIFWCELLDGPEPSMETCTKPDAIQTDVCWVRLEELDKIELFPKVGKKLQGILREARSIDRIYWGDIL
jgi:8-oxo-dGTP diphosphatase